MDEHRPLEKRINVASHFLMRAAPWRQGPPSQRMDYRASERIRTQHLYAPIVSYFCDSEVKESAAGGMRVGG